MPGVIPGGAKDRIEENPQNLEGSSSAEVRKRVMIIIKEKKPGEFLKEGLSRGFLGSLGNVCAQKRGPESEVPSFAELVETDTVSEQDTLLPTHERLLSV